jgi:hypothetical protein
MGGSSQLGLTHRTVLSQSHTVYTWIMTNWRATVVTSISKLITGYDPEVFHSVHLLDLFPQGTWLISESCNTETPYAHFLYSPINKLHIHNLSTGQGDSSSNSSSSY